MNLQEQTEANLIKIKSDFSEAIKKDDKLLYEAAKNATELIASDKKTSCILANLVLADKNKALSLAQSIIKGIEKSINGEKLAELVSQDTQIIEILIKNGIDLTKNVEYLKNKNETIGKLNEFLTDRELKMVELKKEIEDLKARLESK